MAREYFPKYSEVTKDVYDQVKGILRGYDRLKRKRLELLYSGCYHTTGMPESGETEGEQSTQAAELAYIDERLEAIGQSCVAARGWFGDTVYEGFDPIKAYWNYNYFNYQHIRQRKDDKGPSRSTWNRYKHRLTAIMAEKLKIF